jgi:hypothetical protein
VLITAGASAPEDLVAALCRTLVDRFDAELCVADVFEERVEFGLPVSLKRAMKDAGLDVADRKIRVEAPTVTAAEYGAAPVALTVSIGE